MVINSTMGTQKPWYTYLMSYLSIRISEQSLARLPFIAGCEVRGTTTPIVIL